MGLVQINPVIAFFTGMLLMSLVLSLIERIFKRRLIKCLQREWPEDWEVPIHTHYDRDRLLVETNLAIYQLTAGHPFTVHLIRRK